MAESTTISVNDIARFKRQALHWANHFSVVCLLDSHQGQHDPYATREWVLAIDAVSALQAGESAFEQLKDFHAATGTALFGCLSYDLKNQLEQLESRNDNHIGFPDLYFFRPRYVFEISENKVTVNRNYPETFALLEMIANMPDAAPSPTVDNRPPLRLKCRTNRTAYLQNVEAIRHKIEAGDFYELNYCNEFYNDHASIDPIEVFLKLNATAQAPFSTFFKLNDSYLLCASPERFLKKVGRKLIAQPIKGTIQKGETAAENEALKARLQADVKERAENVMIVDLVRNDLAKSAVAGTVRVEELFGVYTFNTVNQMISTISAEMREEVHWVEAIKNAFPMGSMTGAPKVMVMRQIEHYENFRRGWFSGSVGYVTPEGDFDFNVVIRSILYQSSAKYLSVPVGGAITYDSDPEKEYDEVMLKARSMLQALPAVLVE